MGVSCSRLPPPPLVEVSGPRSKILVPAGSAFTFHPPQHRGRAPKIAPYGPYAHPERYPGPDQREAHLPIYQKVRNKGTFPDPRASGGYPYLRGRDRGREGGRYRSSSTGSDPSDRGRKFARMYTGRERLGRPGGGRPGRNPYGNGNRFAAGSAGSVSNDSMSDPASPRGMGGNRMGAMGGRPGTYNGMGNMSAPNLAGGYQGMQRPGMEGLGGAYPVGMQPGMPLGMQPGMAGYGGAGAPAMGAGMGGIPNMHQQPQAAQIPQYPQQQPIQIQQLLDPAPQHAAPVIQQQRPRAPGLARNAVPMGAYVEAAPLPPSPVRANSDPPPAARLNRGRAPDKRTGPQGQEWIEGDPFLDACFCTTECNCRKGHRVVYRERMGDGQTATGEVRYLLKDMLGRNCGDHSGCVRKGSGWKGNSRREDRDVDWGQERDDEGECRKARKEAREGLNRMSAGLDNIQEKLDAMNLGQGGGAAGGVAADMGLTGLAGQGLAANQRVPYQGMTPSQPQMIDPNLAMQQQIAANQRLAGMAGVDPRAAAMQARQMRGMTQPGLGAMGMVMGMDDMSPYGEGMNFADQMGMYPESMDGMGGMMGMGQRPPRGMMGGGRRGGGRRPPPGMDMYDPRGAARRGRGGQRRGSDIRRPRPEFGDDDMDDDDELMMRGGRGRHGGFGDMGDDDTENWEDMSESAGPGRRGSPGRRRGGRGGGGRRNMSRRGGPENRDRHARMEEDEDEDDGL